MEIPMYPDEDEDDIARSGHKRDLDAAKARIAELEAIESEQRVRISELKSETWAAAEINFAAHSRITELEEQLEGARRWIGSVVKLGASKADRIQAVLATTPSSTGERRE